MDPSFEEARDGNKKAEEELFSFFKSRFKTIAVKRIGHADAEDVAQDACLTVLRKYKTEEFSKGMIPWAYGVLRMKIGNYIQTRTRHNKSLASFPQENQIKHWPYEITYNDLKKQILHCLELIVQKNALYATILNLGYGGYKTEEICQKVQIEKKSLYDTIYRARLMLKKCLETGRI